MAGCCNIDHSSCASYAAPFTPTESEVLRGAAPCDDLQAFTPEGIPELSPGDFPPARTWQQPLHARFFGGGFLFAQERFVSGIDPFLLRFKGKNIPLLLIVTRNAPLQFEGTACKGIENRQKVKTA
jgi:hypothetical protein